MATRTNGSTTKTLLATTMLFFLVSMAGQGAAEDWPSFLAKTKMKYANFEKEIKDMTTTLEFKMSTPGGEVTSTSKTFKKGKKFRMEIKTEVPGMPDEMGPMESVVVCDGNETWMISSMMGKRKLTEGEVMQYQAGTDWWNFLPSKAKLAGTETVSNRDCYVVEIEERETCPYEKMWIDKKKFVLTKAETTAPGGQEIRMLFSEFNKVKDEWEIAGKTEIFMDGNLMSTILVQSLDINKGLSDDLFNPEKVEVKAPNMQDMMKGRN